MAERGMPDIAALVADGWEERQRERERLRRVRWAHFKNGKGYSGIGVERVRAGIPVLTQAAMRQSRHDLTKTKR